MDDNPSDVNIHQNSHTKDLLEPSAVLREMFIEKQARSLSGDKMEITDSITQSESEFMRHIIKEKNLYTCIETGVAHGGSAVTICSALNELEKTGAKCKHIGIDPNQTSEYKGAAIAGLQRCGLEHLFELMEGPGHLMLPKLIERGIEADLVFIDGWHTFDYTMLDAFFADKLLRPGGILMMHDLPMPSKQKVARYLATHRRYRRLPGPAKRSQWSRILSCGKQTLQFHPLKGLSYLVQANLLVLQKREQFEPPYHFFRRF